MRYVRIGCRIYRGVKAWKAHWKTCSLSFIGKGLQGSFNNNWPNIIIAALIKWFKFSKTVNEGELKIFLRFRRLIILLHERFRVFWKPSLNYYYSFLIILIFFRIFFCLPCSRYLYTIKSNFIAFWFFLPRQLLRITLWLCVHVGIEGLLYFFIEKRKKIFCGNQSVSVYYLRWKKAFGDSEIS